MAVGAITCSPAQPPHNTEVRLYLRNALLRKSNPESQPHPPHPPHRYEGGAQSFFVAAIECRVETTRDYTG